MVKPDLVIIFLRFRLGRVAPLRPLLQAVPMLVLCLIVRPSSVGGPVILDNSAKVSLPLVLEYRQIKWVIIYLQSRLGWVLQLRQFALGSSHTCALLDNTSIKCWGFNKYGQLGQGNPNRIGFLANQMGDYLPAIRLVEVDSSPTHMLAISPTPPCIFQTGHPSTSTAQSPTDYSLSFPDSVIIPAIVTNACGAMILAALWFVMNRRTKGGSKRWTTLSSSSAPKNSTAGIVDRVPIASLPFKGFGS